MEPHAENAAMVREQDRRSMPAGRALALPVVGIGASAGGLEALRALLARLPIDTGIGFVVIQHLDPDHKSLLASVLKGAGRLAVVEATDGMHVEPNRVHVIPAGADLTLQAGSLRLVPRTKTGGLHLPIDTLFRALAEDLGSRAIGVVLSGAGMDGTEGLRAIKAAGGIAVAQTPSSAQFRSMPASAIASGLVDFEGTPESIADEIVRLARHPYVAQPGEADREPREPGEAGGVLAAALPALRQHAGVDFSGYKRSTMMRRIERRMALHDVKDYASYGETLRTNKAEALALAQEMLIHVTSFFRDAEAFDELQRLVIPDLIERARAKEDSIRIWVPGCATGEEAYAIAICLLEALDAASASATIKIFGTDLSDEAVETARLGRYFESAVSGVSPERLARFFDRAEGGYRICKRARDLCVFARHDLVRDPPFARLDLVSCRNVLIYLIPEVQRYVLSMLHHCLNTNGYLFLGSSETVTTVPDYYKPISKEHRIFVRKGEGPRFVLPPLAERAQSVPSPEILFRDKRSPAREAQRQADHLLLTRYAPPAVLVNDKLEIIQYRGRTGAFLEPPPGQPQLNLLKMAREGLVPHLHEAIERARTQKTTVRREGVRVERLSGAPTVDLEVIPIATAQGAAERFFLILFLEIEGAPGPRAGARSSPAPPAELEAKELERVKADLVATKDYLESLVAEHQSTSDELAAANEELVAANEELQSTNEELQSAKEELQSTNEELSTVNDQLQTRNRELDQIASDLANILSSVEIPVVIVDLDLCIRRFTPTIRQVAHLLPDDTGRPLNDLKLRLPVDDLEQNIKQVLESLVPKEWEAQRQDGRWFRINIRPYRTPDNRLDGAVLTFLDVDVIKKALLQVQEASDYARSIVETVPVALVVLDSALRVESANGAFYRMFSIAPESTDGKGCAELGIELFAATELRRQLEKSLNDHSAVGPLATEASVPHGGRRVFALTGRPLAWGGGRPMLLLAIDDMTELRALERERAELLRSERAARLEAERANRAKDLFLATLSHELRTPLSTILMSAQLLSHVDTEDQTVIHASAAIERAVKAQARLIDDLLDVSRIVSGKLLLDLGPVDFAAIVEEAVEIMRPSATAKSLRLEVTADHTTDVVYGDAQRLQQVVQNLLTNAVKFTPHGGSVSVQLRQGDGRAELTITDTGIGIREEVLPHLFSRFVQADSSVTRTHGGLGLGLSIVRHLVEMHGGQVRAESAGEGKGSTFRVSLPLGTAVDARRSSGGASADAVRGVRVLLVEDDDDTRDAYAAMLAAFGAEVRATPSCAAALAALEDFHPQVILSDIAMPGEDGFTFVERLRRLPRDRGGQTPAAAVTALASNEDRERALRSGFQLHVAKPLDAARLAEVVATLARWPDETGRG